MFPAGMSPVISLIYACSSCTLSSRQLSACTQCQWPKDYIFGTALICLIFNVAHKRVWETYSPAAITSASVFRIYRVLDVCGVRRAVCDKCARTYAPFRDAPAALYYYGGWHPVASLPFIRPYFFYFWQSSAFLLELRQQGCRLGCILTHNEGNGLNYMKGASSCLYDTRYKTIPQTTDARLDLEVLRADGFGVSWKRLRLNIDLRFIGTLTSTVYYNIFPNPHLTTSNKSKTPNLGWNQLFLWVAS
ncbi:hypothetical protein B0H13DRAFT_1875851 [Mycena leptocephala]|nr:hypothetical protein B0H13DRAFT_1875851 [Mycena leptocephala]